MNKVCGNCVHYPLCYYTRNVGANDPCRIGDYGFFRAKAKDPLPTVKVLVDVEKLREIEWCGHLCPVCDGVDPNWSMAIYVEADKKGHTPECWLGNALKAAE